MKGFAICALGIALSLGVSANARPLTCDVKTGRYMGSFIGCHIDNYDRFYERVTYNNPRFEIDTWQPDVTAAFDELSDQAGVVANGAAAIAQLNVDLTATVLAEATGTDHQIVQSDGPPATPGSSNKPVVEVDAVYDGNDGPADSFGTRRAIDFVEGEGEEPPVEVAEPSLLALLGIGALLLGLRYRRR